MFKKTLLILAASSMLIAPTANAGLFKKAVIGTGIIGGGIVAYKMAKKLNVGGVTENLANYIDNAPKTLDENPSFIPTVKENLQEILNAPDVSPEELKKYVVLDDLMRDRYGGGTTIVNPERKAIVDSIRNGAAPTHVVPNPTPVINGGKLIASKDELKLEENMISAGMGSKPKGYKAFHIISTSDVNFHEARAILSSVGVDINHSENGVYLPTGSTQGSEVHTSKLDGNPAYATYVTRKMLENKGSKQDVLRALGDIFLKLSSGDNKF